MFAEVKHGVEKCADVLDVIVEQSMMKCLFRNGNLYVTVMQDLSFSARERTIILEEI